MNSWFSCKIQYEKQDQNGRVSKASEQYLIQALSFTEVETRMTRILANDVPQFIFQNIARAKVNEVFRFPGCEGWFKCKVFFIYVDESNGKDKRVPYIIYVQADNILQAYEHLEQKMVGNVIDYALAEIAVSQILDVIDFNEGSIVLEESEAAITYPTQEAQISNMATENMDEDA